jgi:hypothetical protein
VRQNRNIADDEKPENHVEQEHYTDDLELKVSDLTTKAEKALRDLIDYRDELAMQDAIMKEVGENIAAAPTAQPAQLAGRRRLRELQADGEEGDEQEPQDENDAPAADENILSAIELLKKAKEEHTARYTSKTMRAR